MFLIIIDYMIYKYSQHVIVSLMHSRGNFYLKHSPKVQMRKVESATLKLSYKELSWYFFLPLNCCAGVLSEQRNPPPAECESYGEPYWV